MISSREAAEEEPGGRPARWSVAATAAPAARWAAARRTTARRTAARWTATSAAITFRAAIAFRAAVVSRCADLHAHREAVADRKDQALELGVRHDAAVELLGRDRAFV